MSARKARPGQRDSALATTLPRLAENTRRRGGPKSSREGRQGRREGRQGRQEGRWGAQEGQVATPGGLVEAGWEAEAAAG